jgi:hypothetical protein
MSIHPIDIMSPAGSWESLHAAIQGGANSVYFGIEFAPPCIAACKDSQEPAGDIISIGCILISYQKKL